MTDDASLTDFSSADADDRSSSADRASSTDADDRASERVDRRGFDSGEAVSAVTSTYGWGEYTCSRCGDETQRVWHDEGALVCPTCKPW